MSFRLGSATLVLLGLVACAEPTPGPVATRQPNILLVSLDTLRADHLSSYGYERHTSPFLDRLAAEGERFSHAFANTHGTPPSHATLFTSLYQETHRVSFPDREGKRRNDVVPEALHLLPELLQEAGYTTVAVTAAGFMSPKFGFDQGFDSFRSLPRDIRIGADVLTTQLDRARRSGKPVFALFHTYEIHSPYAPPGRYLRLFGAGSSTFEPSSKNLKRIQNDASRLTEEELLSVEASYDAGIRYADDQLRRLFERLEERGFFDNTLVILLSDHGEEFGEHGGLLHRVTLYDELLHVPLILWGTRVPRAVVDPRMVSLVDVAPTILAAAGVAVPPSMVGKDLLTGVGGDPSPRDAVFAQYTDLLYCIRTARFKLIRNTRTQRTELYDLRLDPGEHNDLSEVRPEISAALRERLERWRRGLPALSGLESGQPDLDESERERLRALGYLD